MHQQGQWRRSGKWQLRLASNLPTETLSDCQLCGEQQQTLTQMAYKKRSCQRHLDLPGFLWNSDSQWPSQGYAPLHDVFPLPLLELHYACSRKQPLPSYKHSLGFPTKHPATLQLLVHPSHLAVTLAAIVEDWSDSRGEPRVGRRKGKALGAAEGHTYPSSRMLIRSLEAGWPAQWASLSDDPEGMMESLDKVTARAKLGDSTPSADCAVPKDRIEQRPHDEPGRWSGKPWFL